MVPKFQAKILRCMKCGKEFTWSANEQEWFHNKGYTIPPKRCRDCRVMRHYEGTAEDIAKFSTARDTSTLPERSSIIPPGQVLCLCDKCGDSIIISAPRPYGTVFLCRRCMPVDDANA